MVKINGTHLITNIFDNLNDTILYSIIWKPIEKYLNPNNKIYFSPIIFSLIELSDKIYSTSAMSASEILVAAMLFAILANSFRSSDDSPK